MAVRASFVHSAIPRSTKDTAALREVNFFSRFSIRICWDTYVVKTQLPGGQTIVQLIPGLHLAKVSRQLKNSGTQKSCGQGRSEFKPLPAGCIPLRSRAFRALETVQCRSITRSRRIWLEGLPSIASKGLPGVMAAFPRQADFTGSGMERSINAAPLIVTNRRGQTRWRTSWGEFG